MQAFGRIVKNPFEIADGNFDAIRIFSFLKNALSFDHIFSIGFRSGLYGGVNTDRLLLSCPVAVSPLLHDGNAYYP